MWMDCFAGFMRIEGDDVETIADRFVAQAGESYGKPRLGILLVPRTPPHLDDARGFEPVDQREHDTVMRRTAIMS